MRWWTVRRPVLLRPRYDRRDVQLDPPRAWCPACGAEVWERVCPACDAQLTMDN